MRLTKYVAGKAHRSVYVAGGAHRSGAGTRQFFSHAQVLQVHTAVCCRHIYRCASIEKALYIEVCCRHIYRLKALHIEGTHISHITCSKYSQVSFKGLFTYMKVSFEDLFWRSLYIKEGLFWSFKSAILFCWVICRHVGLFWDSLFLSIFNCMYLLELSFLTCRSL